MRAMFLTLALATSVMSSSAFAITGAVDSFLGILPLGTYQGQDDDGKKCEVGVYKLDSHERAIAIVATDWEIEAVKTLTDDSEFYLKDYKKEFIRTEKLKISTDGSNYKENVIRTVIAGDRKLYVVVSNSIILNRKRISQTVECVVNL